MTAESLPLLFSTPADAVGDDLRLLLSRLAAVAHPAWERLDRKYAERLEQLGIKPLERRCLAAITVGAAARLFGRGDSAAEFLEETTYQGRRLAKLDFEQNSIPAALAEYEKLLLPVIRRKAPVDSARYESVRQHLLFPVVLTLNNAYYQVREAETQAFYEVFWAELEARQLDDLLGRFMTALAKFCRADQARFFLLDSEQNLLVQRACHKGKAADLAAAPSRQYLHPFSFSPAEKNASLDPAWNTRFATVWSVPMLSKRRLAGVLQFAFAKPYDWLPRERQLLVTAAERCMMAIEKQRLVEHLGLQERQIRKLAEGMMHVEEAERRRISRELHDQTGQDLLWIRLQMEMIEQELPEGDKRWKTRMADVRDMTERTIVEVRRLIGALSPAVLEQLGLAAAMRQLVNRFRQSHQSKVKLNAGRLPAIPKQLEVIAYRLVQECLNNVAKHSSCSNVNISLSAADQILTLHVEDDGVGFHVEEGLAKDGSFGLSGIQERVALLGGRVVIESRVKDSPPGSSKQVSKKKMTQSSSGTKIYVELPIPREGGHPKTPTVDTNPNIAAAETMSLSGAR